MLGIELRPHSHDHIKVALDTIPFDGRHQHGHSNGPLYRRADGTYVLSRAVELVDMTRMSCEVRIVVVPPVVAQFGSCRHEHFIVADSAEGALDQRGSPRDALNRPSVRDDGGHGRPLHRPGVKCEVGTWSQAHDRIEVAVATVTLNRRADQ